MYWDSRQREYWEKYGDYPVSAVSSIQWTDRTWNPVRGCSVISPGCVNCYAMKMAHRFSGPGKPYDGLTKQTKAGPQWNGQVATIESALLEPLSWRKPARVFVNSMSDLFHEAVPDGFIDRVFGVMACAPHHTFQVLTKRADRMRSWAESRYAQRIHEAAKAVLGYGHPKRRAVNLWPLENVWLGVSVEDQQRYDQRIGHLLRTPAAVRFLSAEPLLGPIDMRMGGNSLPDYSAHDPLPQVDWVIVGGESGSAARPFDLAWARSLQQQCREARVALFMKQLGAKPLEIFRRVDGDPMRVDGWTAIRDNTGDGAQKWYRYLPLNDRHGGDINEWPDSLRTREFPTCS